VVMLNYGFVVDGHWWGCGRGGGVGGGGGGVVEFCFINNEID